MHSLNLSRLLRPYVTLLVLAFAATLVQGGASLLEPWPLKVIFDYVIGSKRPPAWLSAWTLNNHSRLTVLHGAAVAVIAIAILGAIGAYANKYLSTTVAKRVGHDMRRMLYHHVQRLSLSFYEHRQSADMVIRLTSDIEAAEEFIASALLGIVLDVLTLAGMVCVMFFLDWRFSLIGLSVAPVLFAIVFSLTRRIKKAARAVKKQESELASVVQESISSARVIKAFAREDFEEQRLERESEEAVNLTLRARSIKARLPSLVDIVVAGGTCLVLWFGVRLVLESRLSAGALLVFVLYLDKMYKPMKDLSKMSDGLAKAAVALDRIGEIMSIDSQVRDLAGAREAPSFRGRIEFDRVRFAYGPDHPVLDNVSLVIEPGQCVALVGLTGSGKSTMLALIARLYDVLGGEIRIDGDDVRRYTLQSLRQQMSFVLQEPLLFRASIARNIAYGKPDATDDEVLRAARLASVDEFAARMPHGYDTVVGERGETLSGGQRQRIAIARAIVRDAPILLLDEPSASLDSKSERLIFDGLARLMRRRTSIVIAHRLATVRRADVVFVLGGGRIAERGTHEELVERGGLYSQLYRIQFPKRRSNGSLGTFSQALPTAEPDIT